MSSGIGFTEILLILAVMVIFIDPKKLPGLLKKALKIAGQIRKEIQKFMDEVNKDSQDS